jgi:integrase
MRGHLRERSPGRWAIILDVQDSAGKRKRKWHSFAGTKREAQAESARLITELKSNTYVERNRQILNAFLDQWERDWAASNLSPKTAERYWQLLQKHVRPRLGARPIQSIQAEDLNRLYSDLHKKLAPRTIRHIHLMLHRVFGHAMKWGVVKRNVVALVDAPKIPMTEATALQLDEIPRLLTGLRERGRTLYPIVVTALGTGMRRGELCALRWQDVDLDGATLRVERSLEQTRRGGLRFKGPKSARSRRTISLSPAVVAELRAHRLAQQEHRLRLGLGKVPPDTLVFGLWDGSPRQPDNLSRDFGRIMQKIGMPHISLHALRHTHASQLITSGMDVLTVSRRLGHGSAAITLSVYGHLLTPHDRAADIMQAMLTNAGVKGEG